MSAIPLDLIVEILCQLPVKSLLRFRCLSKEFRSIIDDPDFIRRHHNACLETNSNRRIIATNNARTTLFSLDLDSAGDVVAAAKLPDLPIQNWRYGLTSIIGSCHGLLALSSHNHLCQITEVLWNISTNKLRILPRIPGEYSLDFIGGFGFGYDVASDDYKLVRIFWNQSSTKFIVYSLRANSWRWIEDLPDYNSFYIFCQGCGILVAGTLHWLWEREIDSREFIISFDLKSEKFYSVPMPDIASTTVGKWGTNTYDLEGCLCLSYNDGCEQVVDIWVMKEYNVKDSWTKLFSFSYLSLNISASIPHIVESLFYSKTGENVFLILDNSRVIRHNMKKGKDEIVEVGGCPIHSFKVTISYVDSLVFL
ncbi:hypothetical protein ACOSP7_011968 [Xanthoceras sorbifolium]